MPDQKTFLSSELNTNLCNPSHMWESHNFSDVALVVCYIFPPLALNTPSYLHNVDLFLNYDDDHKLTTCLVYVVMGTISPSPWKPSQVLQIQKWGPKQSRKCKWWSETC